MKKYNIIYADPPWMYNNPSFRRRVFFGSYPLMEMSEIKELPIPRLADENCALFMWCTFPFLNDQIKLFNEWEFEYKTVAFTWMKTNSTTNGRLFLTHKDIFFGIGNYTRSNAEVCLLGIKGKMKAISHKVSSAILAPIREHSRKPDEARERIVELFGDLSRIELFARQKFDGWDVWGNEVESDVDMMNYDKKSEKYN